MKDTVPHVITQWKSGQTSKEGLERKQAHRRAKASSEYGVYLKPVISPTRTRPRGAKSVSSLSLLGTPENERWDFGSIRHIRQHSSDAYTPISAVDSVFERPCDGAFGSPNSSNHSSFIAELEDTSPIAMAKLSPFLSSDKSPVFPETIAKPIILNPRMEFKTADITVSLRTYPFSASKLIVHSVPCRNQSG
jgi:hypothetical protein